MSQSPLPLQVADRQGELQHLLDTLCWLDTVVARHRYTGWIRGTTPEFVPMPWDHCSPPQRGNNGAVRGASGGEKGSGEGHGEGALWVHLWQLRHPLLWGWHLRRQAEARRKQVLVFVLPTAAVGSHLVCRRVAVCPAGYVLYIASCALPCCVPWPLWRSSADADLMRTAMPLQHLRAAASSTGYATTRPVS